MENITSQPKMVEASAGKALTVLGDTYIIKLSSADTGGHYSVTEIHCQPGSGTPPHVHSREDEAFYILEGEVTFTCDGKTMRANAGAHVHAPRNVPHHYSNESGAVARLLVTMTPGGNEAMFEEIDKMPPGPPDMNLLVSILERYGIKLA